MLATPQTGQVHHRTVKVDGLELFYREAGAPDAPAILLLHGFPSSSHMFRGLLARLAHEFHCIAPDLPGFGYTESPPADRFAYTFDHLARIMAAFTEEIGLQRFAMYLFDYGAPVGFRLATAHPHSIRALIIQNGNAYEEGLSAKTEPLQAYWRDREANAARMRDLLRIDLTRFQYTEGVRDVQRLSPDSWTLDQHFLDLPGREQAMLDLLYDYRTNIENYPAWQAYLRRHRPPTLIVWGRNDPFFSVAGAEAYRRDVPEAEIHMFDTGHFALEDHEAEIAERIRDFLRSLSASPR